MSIGYSRRPSSSLLLLLNVELSHSRVPTHAPSTQLALSILKLHPQQQVVLICRYTYTSTQLGQRARTQSRNTLDGSPKRLAVNRYIPYLSVRKYFHISPAGKAYFANRDIHTAPDHYLKLLELNPPLHFMNASGPNKARVTLKYKQSKT